MNPPPSPAAASSAQPASRPAAPRKPARSPRRQAGGLTTQEAAAALGVQPQAVRAAIRYGSLAASRWGDRWQLEAAEVDRYRRERGPGPGSPKRA